MPINERDYIKDHPNKPYEQEGKDIPLIICIPKNPLSEKVSKEHSTKLIKCSECNQQSLLPDENKCLNKDCKLYDGIFWEECPIGGKHNFKRKAINHEGINLKQEYQICKKCGYGRAVPTKEK